MGPPDNSPSLSFPPLSPSLFPLLLSHPPPSYSLALPLSHTHSLSLSHTHSLSLTPSPSFLFTSFENLNKKQLKYQPYIDVWPLQVKFEEGFDNTFMLLLQLACVLHMKTDWKSHTSIRLFIISEGERQY